MTVPMILLRRLLACGVALVAPVGILIGYFSLRSAVPDPVPVHWGVHGEVNNTASVTGFFVASLVVAAVLAVAAMAAIWLAHSPMAGRMLASLLGFGAWMAVTTYLATMLAANGAASAQAVPMPWYAILAAVVVALLAGCVVWALLPARWQPWAGSAARPTMTLAPGERVVWIGHEHSAVMRAASAVLGIAGGALLFVQPRIAIPVFVVAVAVALVSELAVRIDQAGVHTLWGPFGWPRPRIPLSAIASARAEQIEPMRWGGWGYRVSSRGVAAVIRRGPGLVIERINGPAYAVTVTDADRGAEVLAALLARERSGSADPGGSGVGSAGRDR